MEIELHGVKIKMNQKNNECENLKETSYNYSLNFAGTNQRVCLHFTNHCSSAAGLVKDSFLPCNSFSTWHPSINFSNSFFANKSDASKILKGQSAKAGFPVFKIKFGEQITYPNSLLKPLFPYNCKNIFIHLSKKAILLVWNG